MTRDWDDLSPEARTQAALRELKKTACDGVNRRHHGRDLCAICDAIHLAFDLGAEQGAAAERAEVVAWLEAAPGVGDPESIYGCADEIAHDIKQGCHIRTANAEVPP